MTFRAKTMIQEAINSDDVKDMLSVINDGFLFESFAQEFLTARLGYGFLNSGGIKDRGIDGLEHTSNQDNKISSIFQITIDKKPPQKLQDTLEKLEKNGIQYSRITYVTNINVKNKDKLMDLADDNFQKNLRIYDGDWIANNCNHSAATQAVIKIFISRNLREMQKPRKEFIASDLVKDPRLYIFLKQQITREEPTENLNHKLIESLILYSLRDTDPDKNILLSADEIEESVKNMFDFEVERLRSRINKRLKSLAKKPNRKVNHHTNSGKYCLPFNTRLRILSDNSRDRDLYNIFELESENILKKHLKNENVITKKITKILKKVIELIYYKQGLEFSNFLLNDGPSDLFEGKLTDTVESVLDEVKIIDTNRNKVKTAIILSIRELVYSGTPESKNYLKSLSKTYLMLFLLKCDPKVINYFQEMAGKMRIFVCTSIIVPAFSEIYLEDQNKRYWNLLKSARLKGVRLLVNDTIVDELVAHINNSNRIYQDNYHENIKLFNKGKEEFIDQIFIRAFLYAKNEGKVKTYKSFLDNFITLDSSSAKQEIIDFLEEEFGIEYISPDEDEMKVNIDKDDYETLFNELSRVKGSPEKAKADASLILAIYSLRSRHGETKSSIGGYKTWWLSSDTATHQAVSRLFNEKYPVSCYMRPDFLYNYISFTPSNENVTSIYEKTFPNLLGVQISNHVSPQISKTIRDLIIEHNEKPSGRIKAKVRKLTDDLKAGTGMDYSDKISSFFSTPNKTPEIA